MEGDSGDGTRGGVAGRAPDGRDDTGDSIKLALATWYARAALVETLGVTSRTVQRRVNSGDIERREGALSPEYRPRDTPWTRAQLESVRSATVVATATRRRERRDATPEGQNAEIERFRSELERATEARRVLFARAETAEALRAEIESERDAWRAQSGREREEGQRRADALAEKLRAVSGELNASRAELSAARVALARVEIDRDRWREQAEQSRSLWGAVKRWLARLTKK